ncbi:hypothetical protein PNP59_04620 [Halobacterium salinarum]|uniref:hypothetical protein n=1 Tax=Halobacterium salinarum TaxID=2242 RepID=UPI002554A877|nr:hypothetical protein [Halobacterium salinarum]MDL0130221.1 hypothetical protein [Halobacterium salinarum]MDL0133158.1 hypothetical protein [Halobacterium salinarum]
MTRFDADTEAARIELVADTVAAHRDRDSQFCTLEAAADASDTPESLPPWVQFADGTLNLDCTDGELEALHTTLSRYGAFTIADRTTVEPDTAEESPGTNVRIDARADDDRVGQFVDTVFEAVYGLPADFELWAVEI